MSTYDFTCDRCDSGAVGDMREPIEKFAAHHYRLVHGLYADQNPVKVLRGERTRAKSRLTSRTPNPRRSKLLRLA